ncbi:hypothetical protein COO60DRAFT_1474449 [Scenedesmus sp. NREL 46B-D3]|nr:hypothetical protein COO60DRAFT_1474449 [Scenedesmus sp. NREL 46B-D3]
MREGGRLWGTLCMHAVLCRHAYAWSRLNTFFYMQGPVLCRGLLTSWQWPSLQGSQLAMAHLEGPLAAAARLLCIAQYHMYARQALHVDVHLPTLAGVLCRGVYALIWRPAVLLIWQAVVMHCKKSTALKGPTGPKGTPRR